MNQIKYPEKKSELEIQALLWYFLRKKKIDARLNVIGLTTETGKRHKLGMVIFKGKSQVCIVECKSWSDSYILNQKYRKSRNTKQINKFQTLYSVPVIVCGHMKQITKTQDKIIQLLKLYELSHVSG
jgi:hypothetical protein